MSIREGFEWTEVEPPVRCVLQRRRHGVGRASIQEDRPSSDRQTDRQEETEGKRDKERALELIYRFTCVHE